MEMIGYLKEVNKVGNIETVEERMPIIESHVYELCVYRWILVGE
jgi:hypothetical protein